MKYMIQTEKDRVHDEDTLRNFQKIAFCFIGKELAVSLWKARLNLGKREYEMITRS